MRICAIIEKVKSMLNLKFLRKLNNMETITYWAIVSLLLQSETFQLRILAVIEKDKDGYVGWVIRFPGCHTQAKTLDELMQRLNEAVNLYLKEKIELKSEARFVGIKIIDWG